MEAALDAPRLMSVTLEKESTRRDYVDSCKCPPFCHAWDICRVKGGPQAKW